MFNYIWPLILIDASNIIYQFCAKSIPSQMNTYASMTITYAVATVFSTLMFFVTSKGESFFRNLALTNGQPSFQALLLQGLKSALFLHTKPAGRSAHFLLWQRLFLLLR